MKQYSHTQMFEAQAQVIPAGRKALKSGSVSMCCFRFDPMDHLIPYSSQIQFFSQAVHTPMGECFNQQQYSKWIFPAHSQAPLNRHDHRTLSRVAAHEHASRDTAYRSPSRSNPKPESLHPSSDKYLPVLPKQN